MIRRFHILAAVLVLLGGVGWTQKPLDKDERENAREMLRKIAEDIRKNYYDPSFHGFDFDGRVREADTKLQSAASLGQAFGIIGWALDGLNDSHTFFLPPGRTTGQDYGWRMQMVGNRCYVTHVRPRSDGEAKGLKPGDEVLSINGTTPTRDNLPILKYVLNLLAPKPGLRLQLKGTDGQTQSKDIMAQKRMAQLRKVIDITSGDFDIWNMVREIENGERLTRTTCVDWGEELEICKMPEFNLDEDHVHELLGRAKKHKALILDLRDNPGGYVDTLARLAGGFFDHEVKIADRVGRKPLKAQMTKPQHGAFTGKLEVLVNSETASAAEIFARLVQLQKRGTVVGDQSAGLVMEAKFYDHTLGLDVVRLYGAVITDADLIMADGKSLEHHGVTPDEIVLPTASDLASGNDPALARAAELLGVKLTPEQAGKLFPYEWPKL